MDVTAITTIVGSLGFPIFASIVLFKQLTRQSEQHKQEMDKMSEAINNNTRVMNELLSKINERSD